MILAPLMNSAATTRSSSFWKIPQALRSGNLSFNCRRVTTISTDEANVQSIKFPDAPNSEHHDVASYLAYSARTGLDTTSKVYTGTYFEYIVASELKQFGFNVKRIGGRSDYGIDLLGTWAVPSALTPLRVILQCKAMAEKTSIRPHHVRELEGAFIGAPPGWRGSGVIGLLVAQKTATKGIRDSLGRSRWPMGFVACSPEGKVQQMLWNQRAEEEGLAGLGVNVRLSEQAGAEQELVLTWKGKPISNQIPPS